MTLTYRFLRFPSACYPVNVATPMHIQSQGFSDCHGDSRFRDIIPSNNNNLMFSEVFIMKATIIKTISTSATLAIASAALVAMPATAQAGTLKLWANDHYTGSSVTFNHCNVDFSDNIYDSGTQNIESWVTIWNNTVFRGDERIATLYKGRPVPIFDKTDAADHATCFG